MRQEKLDFFPMNRAMSLAKEEEDETDTKLDELNEKVDLLVSKMREQVCSDFHSVGCGCSKSLGRGVLDSLSHFPSIPLLSVCVVVLTQIIWSEVCPFSFLLFFHSFLSKRNPR